MATSNHLLELQKEIKEEEDEIFGHINSLINSRHSKLYFTLDENDGDENDNCCDIQPAKQQLNQQHPQVKINRHYDVDEVHSTSMLHRIFNSSNSDVNHLQDYNNSNSNLDEQLLFTNSSDDLNDYQSYSADDTAPIQDFKNDSCLSEDQPQQLQPTSHPYRTDSEAIKLADFLPKQLKNSHDHHQNSLHYINSETTDDRDESQPSYLEPPDLGERVDSTTSNVENHNPLDESAYLEEQCYSEFFNPGSEQQNYPSIQAVMQQATSNLPKPCVFFLEGNCRRSDCKYSHDLSNITCKYWIEGFCFKGELCPFLHSFAPLSDVQDGDQLDEDGLKSLPRKELNPTFAIESEADFPSLPLDGPAVPVGSCIKNTIDPEAIANTIKNQILSSNPSVIFKTVKRKRKRG